MAKKNQFELSPQIASALVENHGKDTSKWPQELRDLLDPNIEAVAISAPISGKVDTFINTDFHYHWVEFVDGATPKHDRAQSLRYAGWEFASTDDVKMCSEAAVMGRNEKRQSKDGGKGWSDDIRSGDRRLMKMPMHLWRKHQKAILMKSYQMAYPQPMGKQGPMTLAEFTPGLRSEMLDPAAIDQSRRSATSVQVKREAD